MKKHTRFTLSITIALLAGLLTMACKPDSSRTYDQGGAPVQYAAMTNEVADQPALTLKTGFDHSKFMLNESGTTGYYYVEAKAAPIDVERSTRAPLNISLVIDRSGSMAGEKLAHAKLAAQYVIDQLSPNDYVSIVQYDDEVQVVATSNKVGDKQLLKRQIEAIQVNGNTNLGGGMQMGFQQVRSTLHGGYVNRVLLLSDGLANKGITDPHTLQNIARNENLQNGITISTFGLGLDYNENLMTHLAEYGSGNYYFIRTPQEISGIFKKELNGLTTIAAQNAMLTVDLPAGLTLTKVFGHKYEQSGNRIMVNFRDIAAGETKAVLLKFMVQGQASKYGIATTLTYDDAIVDRQVGHRVAAMDYLSAATSVEDFGQSISKSVNSQVVLYESNERLEEAMQQVDAGNFEVARQKVRENDAYLQSNSKYLENNPELQSQYYNNSSYESQIKNVETMGAADRNLMQKSTKSTNYDVRNKR